MSVPGAFAATVVYGLAACDQIAVGHFMIGRPIVVGPAVGALAGDAWIGLQVGMALEFLWSFVIPVRTLRVNATLLAALASAWGASSSVSGPAAAAVGLFVAIPPAVAERRSDEWLRQWTDRITPRVERRLESGLSPGLGRVVAAMWTVWFVKSALSYAVFAAAGGILIDAALSRLPAEALGALSQAFAVLPFAAAGCFAAYFARRLGSRPDGAA